MNFKFEISFACVPSSRSTLVRNRADLIVLRGCESYLTHQSLPIANCRFLIGGFSRLKRSIGNRKLPIKNVWKGSLTGKAVVLKTTAHLSLAGSSPVPSANTLPIFQLPDWLEFATSMSGLHVGSDQRIARQSQYQSAILNRRSKVFGGVA